MYNVNLAGEDDSLFLHDLERHMELDFWRTLTRRGGELQVMVSPNDAPAFELALRNRNSTRPILQFLELSILTPQIKR